MAVLRGIHPGDRVLWRSWPYYVVNVEEGGSALISALATGGPLAPGTRMFVPVRELSKAP